MRNFFVVLTIALTIPFIMGMGTGSGGVSYKIPTTDRNFDATIVDSQGVSTKVTQISFDGKTYLTGSRGSATVTVPFEKIDSMEVGKTEEDKKVSAFISLKAGGTLSIMVEGKTTCYGSADFGNIQIEFKDIKKVVIQGLVPKGKP